MRVRTVLASAASIAIGYVLGTRAGRARFEELKQRADKIIHDPEVRQKVSDLPDQLRENLPKAQAAVSDAIKAATEKVQAVASDRKQESPGNPENRI